MQWSMHASFGGASATLETSVGQALHCALYTVKLLLSCANKVIGRFLCQAVPYSLSAMVWCYTSARIAPTA